MSAEVRASLYAFVDGKGQIVGSFDLLNKDVQASVRRVVERNAQAIVKGALRRVPRVTGELASTIRYEMIVDKGTASIASVMAGYGKLRRGLGGGRKRPRFRPGRRANVSPLAQAREGVGAYAPVVEFTKKPFLFPAARIQRSTFYEDLRKALDDSTRKAASASRVA